MKCKYSLNFVEKFHKILHFKSSITVPEIVPKLLLTFSVPITDLAVMVILKYEKIYAEVYFTI